MMISLPSAGAADETLGREAHHTWMEAALAAGLDLSGFDPDGELRCRLDWARDQGLAVACVYTRYSSKHQHSTGDQVRSTVLFAASNRMYVPPEFISVDEAVKGRRSQRDGLDRLKATLNGKLASVLLVFKASRLFRRAYKGYQLIQDEVVEEGLRAVSVSQGIDTSSKSWKCQIQMYGMMDEMLLDTIGDFVREGHKGLFLRCLVVGAVGIGYTTEEVPEGRPTNRGLPRKRIVVDRDAAAMIRQHAEWLLEGMPIAEGLRRWRNAGGPADKRGSGKMTRDAYVRLFTNPRLTGVFIYGAKRNVFSEKKDYTRQMPAPEGEVTRCVFEELRILEDDVFDRLQDMIAGRRTGPRAPRGSKQYQLHDLVIGSFHCPHCDRRFHSCGAHGTHMHCPEPDCPDNVMVNRQEAVAAVCSRLSELIVRDRELGDQVAALTTRSGVADDETGRRTDGVERKLRSLTAKIDDLIELAGEGSDVDRAELMAKVRSARSERADLRAELSRLRKVVDDAEPITPERVKATLNNLSGLLDKGASGDLGEDVVYRAARVFADLVGGRVLVHAIKRAGRKRADVVGRFTPRLLSVAADEVGVMSAGEEAQGQEVWLREPPRLDAIAPEVQRLYEAEGLGFRAIAKRLGIGCGNVYASYLRYYEMRGDPVPPRRPRGRQPRNQ